MIFQLTNNVIRFFLSYFLEGRQWCSFTLGLKEGVRGNGPLLLERLFYLRLPCSGIQKWSPATNKIGRTRGEMLWLGFVWFKSFKRQQRLICSAKDNSPFFLNNFSVFVLWVCCFCSWVRNLRVVLPYCILWWQRSWLGVFKVGVGFLYTWISGG